MGFASRHRLLHLSIASLNSSYRAKASMYLPDPLIIVLPSGSPRRWVSHRSKPQSVWRPSPRPPHPHV